ncbi:MAG TPA: inositol monophosphatase family protein [Candidatus Sulfomarinibacteraceae bacterium]|nr:inositol monophosphatase family protein [Candidatus Sulfomarinibacteraceae bacterium]
MSNDDVEKITELAEQAAQLAGQLLRERWRQPRELSEKGFRDWVTDADYASQALLTETIRDAYPDHGFLAEEEGADLPATGDVIWIIDPVDGTSNYSRQQPNFCISLAAFRRDKALTGVIYDPIRRELFRATRGDGSYLNRQRITTSDVSDVKRAIVALDWSHAPRARQQTLEMLQQVAHEVHTIRAIGSAALALAWLAAGRLDAYFNLSLKPWDYAAGALLIELAGGQIRDLRGWDPTPDKGACRCLATNGFLYEPFSHLITSNGLP